jgi:hypothetical protein
MPPVMIEGFLERKQQSNSGGKRSTIRSWKNYYTVLSGQILCFFKDQHDFKESKAAAAPILIQNASCEKASDYTKKKHVIRLVTADGSEFLVQASNGESQEAWLEKMQLTSRLAPKESVIQSTLQRPSNAPPEPPLALDSYQAQNNAPVAEPLYANVGVAGNQHIDENNGHHNDHDNDHSFSSSEVDAKEKRGMLSKFLGRKPKISTS